MRRCDGASVVVWAHMTAPTDASAQWARQQTVACSVCAGDEARLLFRASDHLTGNEFTLVRCYGCGSVYVNPRPGADGIGGYYPDAYYGQRHPFLAGLMMRFREQKLPRLEGRPGRLLDIGCGGGDFILYCRQYGWLVAGIEQQQSPIMALKQALGIEVYEPAQLAELPSDWFDVVTIWHVLEHVPDPAWTLANVQRVLKPGGTVLIEVPNFGGWQGRIGGPAWFHLDVPRHLTHFERPTLGRLLVDRGLQPVRWQTFSLEYDAFGMAQTILNLLGLRPNHLFQLLIRRAPREGGRWDTWVSVALLPILLAVALPASMLAAAVKQGGVLRVWARKSLAAE